MKSRQPVLRCLLLLCLVAALGFANWKLAELPIDISPSSPDKAAGAQTAEPAAGTEDTNPAPRPLAELQETVARPLFHPSRRLYVAAAEKAPELVADAAPEVAELAASAPSRLMLVGLMRVPGGSQRALIRAEGQAFGTWVSLGEEIDGWRLASVEDNRVTIEKSGGKVELLLHAQVDK